MDPEVRRALADIDAKVNANTRLLKSLHRSVQISFIASSVKWILILGAFALSYFIASPFINSAIHTYQVIQSESQGFGQAQTSFASTTSSWEASVADYFKKK
jgi:hypothetical protein